MRQLNKSAEKPKHFRRTLVAVVFSLVFAGLLSERAFAHGFVYFVSTPITPPTEFSGWGWIAVLLFAFGTYFPLRMSLRWSHLSSVFVALLWATIGFPVLFFLMCIPTIIFHGGHAPIPGGSCPTCWGKTFSQAGAVFVFWNCFGLLLLMTYPIYLLLKTVEKIEKPKRFAYWSWLLTIPLCFILSLTPYIVNGAWVHGWGGTYVVLECQGQISDLHQALVLYALEHNNRLPIAKDYAELYPQIEPYLTSLQDSRHWRRSTEFCIIGDAWDRSPKPFIWNTEYSGREVFCTTEKNILEQNVTEPVVYFEPMKYGRFTILVVGGQWVDCPYTYQEHTFRPTYTPSVFLRHNIPQALLERLRKYEEPAEGHGEFSGENE